MQTSGIFTTAQHSVSLKTASEVATLSPFGDVHREAEHHCSRRWKEYLSFAKEIKRPVFLGIGDYHDFGSAGERAKLQRDALHEDSKRSIGKMLKGYCDDFVEEIEFMRPNLIGLMGGNHDMPMDMPGHRILTMTEYMCERLEVPFLGVATLARIELERHGSRCSVDVFAHHGLGAGRTKGASINAVYRMRDIAQAEIYLQGHNHDKGAWPGTTIAMDARGEIVEVEQLFIRTGSFLKAYEAGQTSYNVDANRGPSSLGWVSVALNLIRDRGEGGRGLWIRKTATVH